MRFLTKQTARQAASYASLLIASATATLWAHSYQARTSIQYRKGLHYSAYLTSWQGLVDFMERGIPEKPPEQPHWQWDMCPSAEYQEARERAAGLGTLYEPAAFYIDFVRRQRYYPESQETLFIRIVTLPFWFIALGFFVAAILLRSTPRFRFGTREALAMTTIAALMAASYATLSRLAK